MAFNAIVALGMLLVILNGGIDLSVGSIVGFTAAVGRNLFRGVPVPGTDVTMFPSLWVIIVVSLAVGMLVGWVNGLLIARLNLAPFIVTLGMLYVARGLTEVLLNGQNITNELRGREAQQHRLLRDFASRPLGLPLAAWVMIILAIIFSIVLNRTPFGRWLLPRAAMSVPLSSGCPSSVKTRSTSCPASAPESSGSCRWPTSAPRPLILGRSMS